MPAQDTKLQWGPLHLNSNMICAIDIRVGGESPDNSDLLEVAFLPLSCTYKLHEHYKLFQVKMRPVWPVDKRVARLSNETLAEFKASSFDAVSGFGVFERWFKDMGMKEGKKIIPLVWNWGIVKPRLVNWMGEESFKHYIWDVPRDACSLLHFINDRSDYWGEVVPFKAPTFAQFLTHSDVALIDNNSVTSNAMALIDAYRKTLGKYIPGFKQG